jgi:hypothetical protein
LGFIVLALGVALIAGLGALESWQNKDNPWAGLIVSTDGEAPWAETTAVSVRNIDERNFPAQEAMAEKVRELYPEISDEEITSFGLELTEQILAVDMPVVDFAPILGSGRLPIPGEYEVLAGIHCRLTEFTLSKRTFRVVGRIRRDVPGVSFAYLLPYDINMRRLFQSDTGTTNGWLDIEGRSKLLALPSEERELEGSTLIAPVTPAPPFVSWGVLLGLVLVAVGGAVLQVRLFMALAGRAMGPLRPVFSAIANYPFLLSVVHIVLYGLFFLGMAASLRMPVDQMRVQNFVIQQFEEGELSPIIEAFKSGEIPRTATAIFVNNYGRATLSKILFPPILIPGLDKQIYFVGVLIPYLGALICAGMFLFTGFLMAPVWSDMASTYSYHSITVTLELEAYVIAAFLVCLLPLFVVRGIVQRRFLGGVGDAAKGLASGALLTGIMLAIAALYEAATLISFN